MMQRAPRFLKRFFKIIFSQPAALPGEFVKLPGVPNVLDKVMRRHSVRAVPEVCGFWFEPVFKKS
jgi:hypothetical protein